MRRLSVVLAALALGVALVWAVAPAGQNRSCDAIGCSSQVSFHLSADLEAGVAYTVEACADDHCRQHTLTVPEDRSAGVAARAVTDGLGLDTDRDAITLTLPDGTDWSGTHAVTLRVVTSDGDPVTHMTDDVEFERTQPNGPGCPPVCWLAEVAA